MNMASYCSTEAHVSPSALHALVAWIKLGSYMSDINWAITVLSTHRLSLSLPPNTSHPCPSCTRWHKVCRLHQVYGCVSWENTWSNMSWRRSYRRDLFNNFAKLTFVSKQEDLLVDDYVLKDHLGSFCPKNHS